MSVKLCPDDHLALAVVVARHIHDTAGGQVGIKGELLLLDEGAHGIQNFYWVMRQDHGTHAHRNAFGPLYKDYRYLGREHQRLLGPAVVAVYVGGELRVVENLLGKRQEAALDVPAGSSGLTGKDVAVVSLLLDEKVAVGQLDQRTID